MVRGVMLLGGRCRLVDEARLTLRLRGFLGVAFFGVDHGLDESFVCSGEDRGECAELGAGFQAAPFEVFEFAVARGFFDVSEA